MKGASEISQARDCERAIPSESPKQNEALKHQGKTILTNMAKADAFAKHYAKVSSLKFSAEERETNLHRTDQEQDEVDSD